jgi:hypothetical protein
MRLIFSMASLLVISLLIFNGYANGPNRDHGFDVGSVHADPLASASNVSLMIQDKTRLQHENLEK